MKSWLEPSRSTISQAIRYALNQRDGLMRFLEGGRIEIDSKAVERAMHQ